MNQFDYDLAVVGLGYVGLPVAVAASRAGLRTVGIDLDTRVVSGLNSGKSHIADIDDDALSAALENGFSAFADFEPVATAAAVAVCVPTPLDESGGPDLGAVEGAMADIAKRLAPGALVVLESTTYPGTTDEVVRPILEESGLRAGVDFSLAFSPERIDPGNQHYGITNTPKVVGGHTESCAARAGELYSSFIDEVVFTRGTREAEMAKLLENTYRHVNIALVNEMAIFCHELGIDLWDSIQAASSKPFGFTPFWPGPGVGGHCIPIDPNYLSHKVKSLGYPFRFVELAQEISQRMPVYVASRIQASLNDRSLSVRGSTVLLLGVTYKANISDQRESPARNLAERLLAHGADLRFCDPYVDEWRVGDTNVPKIDFDSISAEDLDLVVLLQAHDEFLSDPSAFETQHVLDTRGVLAVETVEKL